MLERLRVARLAVPLVGLGLLVASRSMAGDPPPAAPAAKPPAFGIWYAPGAPDDEAALKQMLGVGDAAASRTFSSLDEWAASDCDLLVLRGTDRAGITFPRTDALVRPHRFNALKGKRVLGIGWESNRAFEDLGLELHYTASFPRSHQSVEFQPNSLDGSTASRRVEAFRAATLDDGKPEWTSEAVHLPSWGVRAAKVEVVARLADDHDYAPLARQQNYVYCGIAADIRTWTAPFRAAVRAVADGLRARKPEPFSLVEWETTAPGTLEFELADFRGAPHAKEWFFRFEKPTLFSAKLSQRGSGDTMLFFMGEKSQALRDMERLDGSSGEILEILIPITAECIRANEGRYWTLDVTNFGWWPAKCRLRIDYGSDTVRFPDGLKVPMENPPADEGTIRTLIARFRSADPDTRLLANAALLIVGRPAVPLLNAAKDEMKDRDERVRVAMLVGRIEGDD